MNVSTDLGKAFLDTNVVVYAYAADMGPKHDVALGLSRQLATEARLVLSVQVLNEFYWTATRPYRPTPLSHVSAVEAINDLIDVGLVVPLAVDLTRLALDAMPMYGFSFWDALIWAAAKEAGADTLYSEDFQHGRVVEGVRFVNPFLEPSTA